MGRAPCCDKATVKKGPWSAEEDSKLKAYMEQHGPKGNWIALPQKIGLKRCGKSCRLRWLNYLSPNIKRGKFTEEDDDIICSLYNSIGSRWSVIAAQLPGRTDNDIKNYWNTKLKKKLLEKLKDQHNRHLAAAEVAEAKQNEVNDLKSYIPSQTNLGPYEYETKPTAQVDEHTNINMNCPYVDFDPEIVSRLLEQANCSQVYTIADTSPITQSATFQLNLQQAFDNQIFQLDNDTSVRMVKERLEDNLIDLVNSMNMTSTSQMEASNCINKNSNISQTQNSTVGVAAQISYQTAPAPPLEYTTWIEDHVKLECPTVLGTELPEIVNSPVFPPISCGSPDGNYESGWMNTFNAQNNMNLNMEANEFLMDRNDLLYSTKTNSSLFFERGEGKYGYGSFLEGQMI